VDRCRELFNRIKLDGMPAIVQFIADRQSEELFLDFKRSSDNGSQPRLSPIDRGNFGKAISGFGNSEGGVLVWGVDCSRDADGADVAKSIIPIQNPERFVALLQHAVSGCTIPPHAEVELTHLSLDDKSGLVIVLIPKSNFAPHQALPNRHYYIRAGSDFVPTPHDVLSGMFGRRPQPDVFAHFLLSHRDSSPREPAPIALRIKVEVAIHNKGPGIARDVFSITVADKIPGPNCKVQFNVPDRAKWSGSWEFGNQVSIICAADYRLPPGANTIPVNILLDLQPPFSSDLAISGRVGSSGSPMFFFAMTSTSQVLIEKHAAYLQRLRSGTLDNVAVENIVKGLLTTEPA